MTFLNYISKWENAIIVGVLLAALVSSVTMQTNAKVIYPTSAALGPGDITSTLILDSTILNEDIAASASIDLTKLARNEFAIRPQTTYTGDLFSVASGSTEHLVITSAGRVGIGDGTPETLLEVAGTASISGTTTLRGVTYTWPSADGSNGQALTTNGSGTLAFADLTSQSGNFELTSATSRLGINAGAATETSLEVGGTASISLIRLNNGTEAAPAYAFSNSTGSGFSWTQSVTRIDLSINGTNEWRFDDNKIEPGDTLNAVIKTGQGTNTIPGFTFDGDEDTGLFRVGANILGFTTGGIQKASISATGWELSATATNSLEFNTTSGTQGGCLAIDDADGSGITYCRANNGTLTCNTTSCR